MPGHLVIDQLTNIYVRSIPCSEIRRMYRCGNLIKINRGNKLACMTRRFNGPPSTLTQTTTTRIQVDYSYQALRAIKKPRATTPEFQKFP
jgi:hypothetical protein